MLILSQNYGKFVTYKRISNKKFLKNIFVTNISEICDKLHKHLHPIDFKYARIAKRAYFVGIKEFHAACTLVEIVAEGDAAMPELDFTAACPETEVDWVGGLEHETES